MFSKFIHRIFIYLAITIGIMFAVMIWLNDNFRKKTLINNQFSYVLEKSEIIDNKVVLFTNNNSDIIAINILIKGGAFLDPISKPGLSYIFSKALQNGAGGLNYDEFKEYLLDYAISLEITNARDSISISIKGLEQNKKEIFNLIDILLNKPNLSFNELTIAKKEALVDLNTYSNDGRLLLNNAMLKALYNNRYTPLYGDLSSVSLINVNDLKEYKNKTFHVDNIYFSISGNINESTTLEFIKPIVDNIKANNLNAPFDFNEDVEVSPNIGNHSINIYKENLEQSEALIVFNASSVHNISDIIKLSVLNAYLGYMPDSYLFNELRSKAKLVYSISSNIYYDKYTSYWYVYLAAAPENIDNAISLTVSNIKSILNGNFTNSDLQSAHDWLILSGLNSYSDNLFVAKQINRLQFYNLSFIDYLNIIAEVQKTNKISMVNILNSISNEEFTVIKTVSKQVQ